MFDGIFEGRPSVYLLIAAAGMGFLVAWYHNQRKKKLLYGMAAALAAAVAYAALDWAVETGREQAKRKVQEMAAAVGHNDLDAAFRHVSDRFQSPGGRNKAAFRSVALQHRNAEHITDVIVWDFLFLEAFDQAKGQGRISFLVKARGDLGRTQHLFARCEALFEFNAKESWQLRSFELFEPHTENERTPFPY